MNSEQTMQEDEYVSCSCCGKGILNNAEENTSYGKVPYPDDNGFGGCVSCFGDKTEGELPPRDQPDAREKAIRKKLGWAGEVFYDTRIENLEKKLNAANSAKFKTMQYDKKVVIIAQMIEKGLMF